MATTSNPSYSGRRNQEDCSSRPAQQNPISKISSARKGSSSRDLPTKHEALNSNHSAAQKKKKEKYKSKQN
jgi:hypothetical protein